MALCCSQGFNTHVSLGQRVHKTVRGEAIGGTFTPKIFCSVLHLAMYTTVYPC